MDILLTSALDSVRSIPLQGPVAFLIIILGSLAILGRWGIVLVTLLTVALGFIAHNLIVMNMQTSEAVIGVPEVIYCLGGVLIAGSLIIRFIRFMIG